MTVVLDPEDGVETLSRSSSRRGMFAHRVKGPAFLPAPFIGNSGAGPCVLLLDEVHPMYDGRRFYPLFLGHCSMSLDHVMPATNDFSLVIRPSRFCAP